MLILRQDPLTIISVEIFNLLKDENEMFGVRANFNVLSRLQRVWSGGEQEVRPTRSCCLLMHRWLHSFTQDTIRGITSSQNEKFGSGSCVKHAVQISELQTPHQSKLQICCYIIHHIYITLKNPKAIFFLPPRFPKKATWYHSTWRANSEMSLAQNILWSSTPVFQLFSYCEKSPTPNTFHSNTVTAPL